MGKLKAIYPVLMGSWKDDKVQNLFVEKFVDKLPEIVPAATTNKVGSLAGVIS